MRALLKAFPVVLVELVRWEQNTSKNRGQGAKTFDALSRIEADERDFLGRPTEEKTIQARKPEGRPRWDTTSHNKKPSVPKQL